MKRIALIAAAAIACTAAHAADTDRPATRNRAEIPAEFRWDFTAIYASWDAWDADMKQLEQRIDAYAALKGTLAAGGAAGLLRAEQAGDEIGKLQDKLYSYAALQHDTDTRDQAVAARLQRIRTVSARLDSASAWFTPELLTLPRATVDGWLAQQPKLAPYRFPIADAYRRQAHVLDDRGEALLSLAGPALRAPGAIYSELGTSDIKFPAVKLADGRDVVLSPGNYGELLETERSQDDRARAAAAHVGTYGANANTYAAIYEALLQRDWFMAQARKYPSTLDAALDDNAVPRAVVETLVETARTGAAPLQRYARLRQRLLGLPSYHPYDSFLPIFAGSARYPYARARELALASVAPLGADYVARYRRFVSGGRIDVYENDGKRSGAYNAGVYGVGPYLLLNHNDTLDAAFTLAHEAGHAMHTVLSYENQPFATAGATIFVAEVASTTNERFLLDELLKRTTDPKERFLLLQHAVDEIVGTFYTQVMFADFELRAHQRVERGEPLTTDVLNQLYLDTARSYYGDAETFDDFYKWTWARIPHFFNSPYYVYQYATCFASSAQLYTAMTTGAAGQRRAATERYLTLLKSGGDDEPVRQLQKAGVDLTQRATVQAVVDELDALVTRMEQEAAKIVR